MDLNEASSHGPFKLFSLLVLTLSSFALTWVERHRLKDLFLAGSGTSLDRPTSSPENAAAAPELNCPFPPDMQQEVPRKIPPWHPRPGKYLLGFCRLNRWSNRLVCMERALVMAALLNRTLIIPSLDVREDPSRRAIDVPYLRKCLLGRGSLNREDKLVPSHCEGAVPEDSAKRQQQGVRLSLVPGISGPPVVSLGEYMCVHGATQVKVDRLLCSKEVGSCPQYGENFHNLVDFPAPSSDTEVSMSGLSSLQGSHLKALSHNTKDCEVLCLGDTFYAAVMGYVPPVSASLGPMFGSHCQLLVRPPLPVIQKAEDFAASQLQGKPYAGVHLRREDFRYHCKDANCTFWPMERVAKCLAEDIKKLRLEQMFLASNGWFGEIKHLGNFLAKKGVKMEVLHPAIGWNISKEENKRYWDAQANTGSRAFSELVEKVICSRSAVFFHSQASTFSYRIMQLRVGFQARNCSDKAVCD